MNRSRPLLVPLVVAGLAVLALTAVPTTSGTLTGRITNTTDRAISGITNGSCTSTAKGTNVAYLVWPFDDGPDATSAWDSSRNSRPGDYVNPARITYGAPGPCPRDNTRSVTLSGGADGGYIASSASTAAITGPQTFSAAVWFKTSSAAGGKLIGFGNARNGSSGTYDRHLYLTTAGNVVAGVYPNAVKTVQSAATYNNNVWHLAVMTLSPTVGTTLGLRLYVDGVSVGTDAATVSAQAYSGYWRVGYDNLGGWTNSPGDNVWFAGSVAFASVYTAALTPTQVTALYNAGR